WSELKGMFTIRDRQAAVEFWPSIILAKYVFADDARSIKMPAAIHSYAFSRDEIALDQEQPRLGDLVRTAPSLKRGGFDHFATLFGSQTRRLEDRTRSDRIDQNFWSQLQRETFGQSDNRRFGRIVRHEAAVVGTAAYW